MEEMNLMNLWYEEQALAWTNAIPIGNGRLGGMVYGRTETEIISINEDTLWSGYPCYKGPKNKAAVWQKMRELTQDGKFAEAQTLFEEELSSPWSQSYLPMGDLLFDFNHKNTSNYKRSLDLETAIASVSYDCDGVHYTREIFVSAPDNCMAIRLEADRGGSINFTLSVESQLRSTVSAKNNMLHLDGIAPSNVMPSYVNDPNPVIYSDKDEEKGMRFTLMVLPIIIGGKLSTKNNVINVSGADSVTLIIDGQTSFAGYNVHPFLHGNDEKDFCSSILEEASYKTWEELKSSHIDDYSELYTRMEIDLGENENAVLPTDKRLKKFFAEKNDPSLYALLFQYGRYLLIAGSRPGTQATNLQGIWNKELRAPWSSNYTININTEMNYWPSLPCALEETQLPLVDLVKALSISGKVPALEIYGAPGFTAHHNTDIWAMGWPVGNNRNGSAVYSAWNLSAGWLCAHLFERYEYTLDRLFLEDTAYPIMKEAAVFYVSLLSDDGNGHMWLCPSTSPENNFVVAGKNSCLARTSTMTMAIIRELLTNCVKAARILGEDNDFAAELEKIIGCLFPFQIGTRGELLEWDSEYEEAEPHHRHVSHLYGLYPGNQISVDETPELAAACKKTLELRGDEGTGWSLAWKVNLWARLYDGDHALTILNNQLRLVDHNDTNYAGGGGTYANMFCAHPPFQIDGNFGVSAGIAEMLLQNTVSASGEETPHSKLCLHILPALPSSWGKGKIKGLQAKAGLTVDISWDGGKTEAGIFSPVEKTIDIRCRSGEKQTIKLEAGKVKFIVF